MSVLVPGGAMCVKLKWKLPSVAAHIDSFGLCLHGRMMLTHGSTLGRSLYTQIWGRELRWEGHCGRFVA
jgi:hypothetical protein